MNESLVDILIYLYENYICDDEREEMQERVEQDLRNVGFDDNEIARAFEWMDDLFEHQRQADAALAGNVALRVYSDYESGRLDRACRGYLLHLEQVGILDCETRELVIDRLLALNVARIETSEIRWVVLMVLINHPGRQDAFTRMEELVYNNQPARLH